GRKMGVGLVDGRLEALRGLLALLGGLVADRLELSGDRDRSASRRGTQRRADLLRARLRPAETLLDVRREAFQNRVERGAALRQVADQPLQALLPMLERMVDRVLLSRQLLRRLGQRFGLLGQLMRESAGVGLGGRAEAAERR